MRIVSSRIRSATIVFTMAVVQAMPASAAYQTVAPVAVTRQFDAAVKQFNSPEHEESAVAFQRLIDTLQPRFAELSPEIRAVLTRSYFYHAEVMLDTKHTSEARADIVRLLQLSPGAEPDQTIASAEFVRLFAEERRAAARRSEPDVTRESGARATPAQPVALSPDKSGGGVARRLLFGTTLIAAAGFAGMAVKEDGAMQRDASTLSSIATGPRVPGIASQFQIVLNSAQGHESKRNGYRSGAIAAGGLAAIIVVAGLFGRHDSQAASSSTGKQLALETTGGLRLTYVLRW